MKEMADPHGPLRGEEAGELLRLALKTSGLELETWQRTHLFERPGAEASGVFEVTASSVEGTALLHLIASTVELSDEQQKAVGAVRLTSDGPEGHTHPAVHVWPHPADPELPGLAAACDAGQLGQRITSAVTESGVAEQPPAAVEELSMVVLRPLRRAVLRASIREGGSDSRTVYVKVLRPERADLQLRRHALAPSAPRALSLGDGIVMIDQAAGLPLTEHLHRPGLRGEGADRECTDGEALRQLAPDTLLRPLDQLSLEAMSLPRRATQAERLEDYAGVAIRRGADQERVQKLCRGIRERILPEPGPLVPTHGDFHPANIFLELRTGEDETAALAPSALIDVDTLGPGYRADDIACLLAHLLTLPTLDPEGYAAVPEFTEQLWNHLAEQHDPTDLRSRVAGVLLSLIPSAQTGDRRSAWLGMAERCLQECD